MGPVLRKLSTSGHREISQLVVELSRALGTNYFVLQLSRVGAWGGENPKEKLLCMYTEVERSRCTLYPPDRRLTSDLGSDSAVLQSERRKGHTSMGG